MLAIWDMFNTNGNEFMEFDEFKVICMQVKDGQFVPPTPVVAACMVHFSTIDIPQPDDLITSQELLENMPSDFCPATSVCVVNEQFVNGIIAEFDEAIGTTQPDGMLNETEFKNACLAIKDGWVPVVEPTPVEVCQGHLEAMDNNPEDGMISWDEFLMAPTNFCPSGAMINQEYVAGIWYYKQLANDEKLDSEAFKTICIEV
jgi:hypothetical protein